MQRAASGNPSQRAELCAFAVIDQYRTRVSQIPQSRDPSPLSEERYRLLVDAVTDYAIYMLDPNGFVSSWNRGAQRLKGYTRQEILGQHFSRFYTDQDRATGLPARALRTAREEGRFEQEGWRLRKDGSLMWAHVVIDPILDDEGVLLGYAKITRDVSERKATEDALRQSEERFRLLVQGVHDYAIYMLDPEGRVANWNTGAQRFKGYKEEEIVGQHFSRFYTEEDRASRLPWRALETAAREGRFEHEGWRLRKDGTRFWAHVIIDAIRDKDGNLIGFGKVTRDVTERRAAQEALEEARARFVQAQKMEAIGQLTGGVAHDFNNLLAVVLGNLDLARKKLPPDPKLQQLVENSIQAAERGATLTRRMLAFARRQDLEAAPVDVPTLVRDMADLLQRSIGPSITIDTQFPLRLAPALADANQLELALLNLTVNARDAMPEGGAIIISGREAELALGNKAGLRPGRYVCLSVKDTGEGMDEQTLARSIEPFFTTKGVGKGTGLGLSMIHGFADQSGGSLVLESTKGKGTTAEIWLPIAQVAKPEDLEDEPAGPAASPNQKKLTILVVDDDSLVLMNTTAMLEDLGHEVFEANSGEQALRILRRQHRVDLVITDQLMPGMTGLQLAEEVQRISAGVPIILATGYADLQNEPSMPVTRLSKPFLQRDLARAVAASVAGEPAQVLAFRTK